MNHRGLEFHQYADFALEQLSVGAFLTTKKNGKVNTMTIAWGGINYVWEKPVFVIYVRYSRHTYEMLKENDEFTVSLPAKNDLKKELSFCGTQSGRTTDKIKACNFTLIPGRVVDTPIIGQCIQHYECKVIYRQAMEPGALTQEVQNKRYSNNNYHMIYYGEIVDAYQTKGEE